MWELGSGCGEWLYLFRVLLESKKVEGGVGVFEVF